MTKIAWIGLLAMTLAACSGRTKTLRTETPAATPPRRAPTPTGSSKAIPNSTDSYTQGLLFADGVMWEGTGEYGHSPLQRHRPRNRTHGRSGYAAPQRIGEGIALLDGKIYQLTWENNKAYVYDAATGRSSALSPMRARMGLTTDGERLYMSDGSEYLRILDPETFRVQRSVPVTFRGAPVQLLNELEWIDGKIWANVYVTDQIVIIDPASGIVEGVIDLRGLLPDEEIAPDTDVLNGIAYDAASERIFVTGKRWSKLFEIEIIPQ